MSEQMMTQMIVGAMGTALVWWMSGRFTKGSRLWMVVTLGATGAVLVLVLTASTNAPVQQGGENPIFVPGTDEIEFATVALGEINATLTATGSIRPDSQVDLRFRTSAPVAEIFVDEGEAVEAGAVLAQLDVAELETNVRNAELDLIAVEHDLLDLTEAPREIDVAVAEAAVETARAGLDGARRSGGQTIYDTEISRLQVEQARNQLWQQQLQRDSQDLNPEFRGENPFAEDARTAGSLQASELEIAAAEADYADVQRGQSIAGAVGSAEANLIRAEIDLDELLNPADANELELARMDVRDAELALESARLELERAQIIAPFDGVVALENLTVGELPPSDEVAIQLVDIDAYFIDLRIDETDIGSVMPGQTVELQLDAMPNTLFTGTIVKIDPNPTRDAQLVTYDAEVLLDPTDENIRPGMTTTASIVIDTTDGVLTLPNRFISFDDAGQTVVTVEAEDGTYEEIPVEIGQRNSELTQIMGDIEAGDRAVLLPDESEAE